VNARPIDLAPAEHRLFFALWPEPAVRAAFAASAQGLPGRAVHPDDLHVTLEFLGAVPAQRLEALRALGAAADLPVADLVFDRLEWWRTPRVVVALASAPPPELLAFQAALRRALAAAGYRTEARAYVPHVTLARHAHTAPAPGAFGPLRWALRTCALVESAPRARGARYRPLASWTR